MRSRQAIGDSGSSQYLPHPGHNGLLSSFTRSRQNISAWDPNEEGILAEDDPNHEILSLLQQNKDN
jgi:hypothetical protein